MTNIQRALEVENLRAGYDAFDVLQGMSLHVGVGERVGLFGPNGHGKTTLLNAVSKLIQPRAGSVRFMGDLAGGALRTGDRRYGSRPRVAGQPHVSGYGDHGDAGARGLHAARPEGSQGQPGACS
ncbi:ATP-binding cassette domain-containing protein [Mesorhizobium sediminum]|nr:ATP-binding cassette domain-containing protein [Mesorhizobium sediminum]